MSSILELGNLARSCGGILAFALLVFTPGAWITFGLPLPGIPVWARLFTGATLAPLVLSGEFFGLRLAGVPFGPAVIALIVINLPAIYLIFRYIPKFLAPPRAALILGLVLVVLCVGLMAPWLLSTTARIYSPHAWIYSDPVYMYARGDLNLEDPSLAGVPLRYPVWSALVFQTAVSFVLNSPPVSNWVWVNLVWLLLICGLIGAVARELGGGRLAQACASVCLLLGINPIGYILLKALPDLAKYHLFGDLRYTPWINKFFLFSTMPLGLGMIAALLYLLVPSGSLSRPRLMLAGLLTAGTGLTYPLLFPSACGILGAKALALLLENGSIPLRLRWQKLLPLAGVLAVAILVTYAQVKFLERGLPAAAPQLALSTFRGGVRKAIASVIVTSALLSGLAIVLRKCWRVNPAATTVLIAGALASYVLHAAFSVAYWDNEYKFMAVVAMCLTPPAALAAEHVWRHWARPQAIAVLALGGMLLLGPFLHRHYGSRPAAAPNPFDTSSFYLGLNRQETWSDICKAIRTLTPSNSVLLLENSSYYFPHLTARSMYVPPADRFYPGVTVGADVLEAGVRSNGHSILTERRAVLSGLFHSSHKEESLDLLLRWGRPIVIVAEAGHASLLEWLKGTRHGTAIYQSNGITVWLVPSPQTRDIALSR